MKTTALWTFCGVDDKYFGEGEYKWHDALVAHSGQRVEVIEPLANADDDVVRDGALVRFDDGFLAGAYPEELSDFREETE